MSSKPVRVHVSFKFPNKASADAFGIAFRDEFIARTVKEEGCLLYDVWQANDDPTLLTLIESWTSQELLDIHLAQPWMKEALPRVMGHLGEGNKPAFHFCTSVMDKTAS